MGLPIVIYLFLGGAGAGACLALSLLGLLAPRASGTMPASTEASHRRGGRGPLPSLTPTADAGRFLAPGFIAAAATLAAGICCLIVDLGRLDRLSYLITRPTLSYISIGAYALAACFILALTLAVIWLHVVPTPARAALNAIQALAAAVSSVVMMYTGLLLSNLVAAPLWGSAWLPVLFTLSAASCGVALTLLAAYCTNAARLFPCAARVLVTADIAVIALEAAATALFVADSLHGIDPAALIAHGQAALGATALTEAEQTAALGAFSLIGGMLAEWFWGGYVLVGLAVPFGLELTAQRVRATERKLVPACAVSVLIGGFVMRYCIVMAGTQGILA